MTPFIGRCLSFPLRKVQELLHQETLKLARLCMPQGLLGLVFVQGGDVLSVMNGTPVMLSGVNRRTLTASVSDENVHF